MLNFFNGLADCVGWASRFTGEHFWKPGYVGTTLGPREKFDIAAHFSSSNQTSLFQTITSPIFYTTPE